MNNKNFELKANFHTHTTFCDGSHPAEEVVLQAIDYGFETLGFSGHMDPDIHMDLPAYLREIKRLQKKYREEIEILCGIELDTLYVKEVFGENWDGIAQPLLYDANDPEMASLDFWIGSTHFIKMPDGNLIGTDAEEELLAQGCREYYGGDYYRLAEDYFALEATAFEKTHCDFIGHFDLITRFNDSMHFLDENDPRYQKPALEAMEYLVKQEVPFEINCGAVNRGRKKEFYPNMFFLRALKDFGGEILINSDAHQKEKLNGAFPEALQAARAAGFDHINVLTKRIAEGTDPADYRPSINGGGKVYLRQIRCN